jgi:hypothetical protein
VIDRVFDQFFSKLALKVFTIILFGYPYKQTSISISFLCIGYPGPVVGHVGIAFAANMKMVRRSDCWRSPSR